MGDKHPAEAPQSLEGSDRGHVPSPHRIDGLHRRVGIQRLQNQTLVGGVDAVAAGDLDDVAIRPAQRRAETDFPFTFATEHVPADGDQHIGGQPVGLIETNWGGTPAQAWTSTEKLASDPALKHYADQHAQLAANYAKAVANHDALQAKFNADMDKWKSDNGLAATATTMEINTASAKAKAAHQPEAPHAPVAADGGQNAPSNLFDGMLAPLIPYGIKGAIWYQGEANGNSVAQAMEYRTLFPAMITDWRARWGEGDFPFFFVQLARYKNPNPGYAVLRESQAKTLSLPNTGMAVAFDVGDQDNIHPKDKLDVGKRLALAAEHVAYGKDLVYSGPVYDKIAVDSSAIRVSFTQVGGGLIIGSAPWVSDKAQPIPTTALVGFTVAGEDKTFYPADAKIDGNEVVVSSAQVPHPVAVRYAFIDAVGNLYNKDGLPAPPFRSDDWTIPEPPKPAPRAPAAPAVPAPAPAAK